MDTTTGTRSDGPAQLVLIASIARRYYVDGRSKVEIADEFGLSRFKVARLLDQARSSGMVRIEIGHPGGIDLELSARLQEHLGLRRAIVVDTPEEEPAALRAQLGKAAADLLSEIVTPDDVLGLAWARAVTAMTAALTSLAPVPVVQLTGALSRPGRGRQLGRAGPQRRQAVRRIGVPVLCPAGGAGRGHRPHAAPAARGGRRDRAVRGVTKAVVGLGRWAAGQSTLYDAMDDKAREQLGKRGVIADISGVFVTADGEPLTSRVTDRVIAVNAEQMAAIDEVIAIPYGLAKLPAVRAAVRSGLVNGLVTHGPLARALLED